MDPLHHLTGAVVTLTLGLGVATAIHVTGGAGAVPMPRPAPMNLESPTTVGPPSARSAPQVAPRISRQQPSPEETRRNLAETAPSRSPIPSTPRETPGASREATQAQRQSPSESDRDERDSYDGDADREQSDSQVRDQELERMRREAADALCDRHNVPREYCESMASRTNR